MSGGHGIPLETLIEADAGPLGSVTPEERSILTLLDGRYLSVADLSASLQVSPDVIRARIASLSTAGRVWLHAAPVLPYNPGPKALATSPLVTSPATINHVMTPSVLECALNGLATL